MFSCFQIYCTLSFHIVGCIKGSSAICRNSYMIDNTVLFTFPFRADFPIR